MIHITNLMIALLPIGPVFWMSITWANPSFVTFSFIPSPSKPFSTSTVKGSTSLLLLRIFGKLDDFRLDGVSDDFMFSDLGLTGVNFLDSKDEIFGSFNGGSTLLETTSFSIALDAETVDNCGTVGLSEVSN